MSAPPLAEFEAAVDNAANLKHGKRLSVMDRAYAIKARQQTPPASIDAIAEVLGCHRVTVQRILNAASLDVVPVLASYADQAVEDMIEASRVAASKGYQQGALAILHYGQKLEPLADAKSTTGVNITINAVPLPGTPSYDSLVNITPLHSPLQHPLQQQPSAVIPASIALEAQLSEPVAQPSFRPLPSTGESET